MSYVLLAVRGCCSAVKCTHHSWLGWAPVYLYPMRTGLQASVAQILSEIVHNLYTCLVIPCLSQHLVITKKVFLNYLLWWCYDTTFPSCRVSNYGAQSLISYANITCFTSQFCFGLSACFQRAPQKSSFLSYGLWYNLLAGALKVQLISTPAWVFFLALKSGEEGLDNSNTLK